MSEFAGTLRTNVRHLVRDPARDALGDPSAAWRAIRALPAEIAPEEVGASFVADAAAAMPRWRVTARPFPVAVGERLEWDWAMIEVRSVRSDPRRPDRIVVIGEELR